MRVRIDSVTQETPRDTTLTFDGRIEARPGQFVMITDFKTGEKPFFVSCVEEETISITLRAVGPFTNAISQLKVGDIIGVRGAYGSSFFVPERERVLVIGGGRGAPPLHLLTRQLVRKQNTVVLLNGAGSRAELLFQNRFEAMGVQSRVICEDDESGAAGTVVDLAADALERDRFDRAYGSGPELMLAQLHSLLTSKSILHQFLLERYMKCGIGICGSCVMDDSGIRICVEGPVVNDKNIGTLIEFGHYRRDASGRKVSFSG